MQKQKARENLLMREKTRAEKEKTAMKDIKVGIVGLGRLGSVHAQNLAFKIPGCKLVAACSLEQKELDWAKDYLKVEYTTTDYKKMVDEADIEAVVIVSSSPEHCWMIEYALDAGKHVFTDKPLGCSLEECKRAEAAVERHPDKLFFLGFMRRYDPSYADAKAQIDAGHIGKPYLVKASRRSAAASSSVMFFASGTMLSKTAPRTIRRWLRVLRSSLDSF